MEVKIERSQSSLVIRLVGELDHHAASQALLRFSELEAQALPSRCTLDLGGLRFTDSSGIAVVLGLQRRVRDVGGTLVVTNTPPQAMRVFGAAGLCRAVNFE